MRMSRRMGLYSVKRKIYLYANGEINADVTGGLTAYAYIPNTSGSTKTEPTITEGSSAITISVADTTNGYGTGGTVYTEDKINLTNAKTINIDVSSVTVGSEAYVRFGATATKATGYTVAAAKTIRETGILSLDVSDLDGSFYLIINLYGAFDKSVKFTEWWIE